jgi:glutaredoxin
MHRQYFRRRRGIMKKFSRILILALVIAGLLQFFAGASSLNAEIFQYKDADGNVIFGDAPPAGVEAREKKVSSSKIERQETKGTAQKKQADKGKPQMRDTSDIQVVLYMADWCPYCVKAQAFLRAEGVRLTEYNIDKDPGKKAEAKSKARRSGIPVIDIEGSVLVGFSEGAIKEAIMKKRREGI